MESMNPFSGRGEPVQGERLVGRRSLIDRLLARVQSEAHCSVVGLPRMGKTSIVREVLNRLKFKAHGFNGGYLTLDAIRGPVQAYARILEETALSDELDANISVSREHDEVYEFFLRALRKRRRAGRKSVIVLDEVDAIVRDEFVDAQLFVSRLREVANDRDRYGVTFIFVSRRSLDMIQGAVDCSTLAGLCEVIYAKPLDRAGLDAIADRSYVKVTDAGLDALWRMTGGHPYLAEVVMCEAVDNYGGEVFDNKVLEGALRVQAHEFTNQYRQLTALLAHDRMFDALCELVVGPAWRSIDQHSIWMLRHYGLLRSSDASVDGLECMSQHFKEYLSLMSRSTPSWVLLGSAERELRYLVHGRLEKKYGVCWLDKFVANFPKLAEAVQKLEKNREKEKKSFGDAASDFILDYAYIADLKDIIFSEWDCFRDVFKGEKVNWEKKFIDITRARNPMAHHRNLPLDVVQEAERSCKSILKTIHPDN